MKNLIVISFILSLAFHVNAQAIRGSSMLRLSDPSISVTGSITLFSTATGTASGSQILQVSGQSLIADMSISASGGGLEFSTDNASFSSPKTIFRVGTTFPGQPVFIYIRVPQSASVGTYSGNIIFSSSGAAPVQKTYNATVNAAVTEEKFSFGKDNTMNNTTGWTLVYGNPSTTDISVSGLATGWTFQIYHLNWQPFGGNNYASNNFGPSTGTFGTEFPQTVIAGSFLNSGILFNSSTPNYGWHIDNLPTGTYKIRIISSISSSILNTLTTPDLRIWTSQDGDVSMNSMNMQDNTGVPNDATHVSEWTVHITTGEILKGGCYAGPGFNPGGAGMSAMRIQKL